RCVSSLNHFCCWSADILSAILFSDETSGSFSLSLWERVGERACGAMALQSSPNPSQRDGKPSLLSLCPAGLCPRRLTNLRLGRHLAQLQSADVGDNPPAIFHRNLRRISRHCAPTISHRVK